MRTGFRGPASISGFFSRYAVLLAAGFRWEAVAVPLFYLGLSLWAFWPALATFGSALVGYEDGDVIFNAWGHWWIRTMLVDHLEWPSWTNLVNYPYGMRVFTVDTLNGLFSLPAQLALGPAGGYNTFLVCALAFSGCGAYLLARRLTGSLPAALVAGAIYGFSPVALSSTLVGTSEVVNAGWIPLFLICLLRVLRTGTARDGALTGVTLACTTLSNWYFGYMASLVALPIVLVELSRGGGVPLRDRLRALALAALIFASFSHVMIAGYRDVFAEYSAGAHASVASPATKPNIESLNIGNFFLPTEWVWKRPFPAYYHLAPLTLVLAGLGLLLEPRRSAFPAALGLTALLLAMGNLPQTATWLPASLDPLLKGLSHLAVLVYSLIFYLPFGSTINFPARWVVVVGLAAALVAAFGLARILGRLPARASLALGVLLAIGVVGNSLESTGYHRNLATTPLRVPLYVRQLLADPKPGAVVHVPMEWRKWRQLLDQMTHGRPMLNPLEVDTTASYSAPDGSHSIGLFPAIVGLAGQDYPRFRRWGPKPVTVPPPPEIRRDLEAMSTAGVRFLVFHRASFSPQAQELFDSRFAPRLELLSREDGTELYRVGP